ncbi:hypothetical protein [Duganella sp. HH105]|uniref:hypothetical protein n=1 Tax=Duganella sp. HH105 TaxID=1781067 RepID=UPI0008938396|nr:hypothetical protein [Duganella sp. HH105]OEZ63019.1 hypothetical protein DUGA6_08120 [Duganella sp. HH105]
MPTLRFVRHITFDHHTEMPGNARTTHGVTHRVFDYKNGREVQIASLFKSNAESELGDLLMDEIARSIKKMKKADRPDTERCQHQRSFEWETVSIQSSTEITIEFPYSSGNDCGEGYYILSGPAVKKLFLSPQDFSKGKTL